jgi:hypothetical protein
LGEHATTFANLQILQAVIPELLLNLLLLGQQVIGADVVGAVVDYC